MGNLDSFFGACKPYAVLTDHIRRPDGGEPDFPVRTGAGMALAGKDPIRL